MSILKSKKVRITISVILILLGIGYFLEWKFEKEWSSYTEYKLSPADSFACFAHTPEEFFEAYYVFYDTLGDFRLTSEIDKKGNLILRLTDEQISGLLEYMHEHIESFKKHNEIEIDEEYKNCTVYVKNGDVLSAAMIGVYRVLPVCQLLTSDDSGEITVTYTYRDSETKEIMYTLTIPYEAICVTAQSGKIEQDVEIVKTIYAKE